MFLQKETSHCKSNLALCPQGIFGDQLYLKNARMLKFHVFLLFHVRKHKVSYFTEVGRIHRKLLILFKLWVPDLNYNKFIIFYEIGPLQVRWWYQMFCSIKMEEHMEPELSDIFLRKDGCQKYSACLVIFLFLAKYGSFTFLIRF